MDHKYILDPKDVKELVKPMGYCIASDRITKDGCLVGFMYREEREDTEDSGWRFMAGDEDDEYLDDHMNLMMFDVNYIANIDPIIVKYLNNRVGKAFERVAEEDRFRLYTDNE